ncbi:MAG: leucine-rich repeat domain-containing protein [Prevotella sp.]|jgi:hypothetical protein|nr:leucine-rich repeat domain-containing protein [Prevotella sp.]
MATKQKYLDMMNAVYNKAVGQIPPPIEQNIIDVSAMFDIPTGADVSAFLFRAEGNNKNLIKLHGYDNSGQTGGLVITPQVGFGPHYNAWLAQRTTADGTTFNDYGIKLNMDNGDTPGSIEVPQDCDTFDVSYYASDNYSSYYVDTDNVMHPFELDNTPIANFCASGGTSSSITINGNAVVKNTIKEIVFGNSYKDVSGISANFLRDCSSLASADLSVFVNVSGALNLFLTGCSSLASINLSAFFNVTQIGSNFLQTCSSITSLDLSAFDNVTHVGGYFLNQCINLTSINIGDVDWSSKSVGTNSPMASVPNVPISTLHAASQQLADKFKAKMNGNISNWTVVIE